MLLSCLAWPSRITADFAMSVTDAGALEPVTTVIWRVHAVDAITATKQNTGAWLGNFESGFVGSRSALEYAGSGWKSEFVDPGPAGSEFAE